MAATDDAAPQKNYTTSRQTHATAVAVDCASRRTGFRKAISRKATDA
jgi:hypothetical protein